jgi:hypothetical protein
MGADSLGQLVIAIVEGANDQVGLTQLLSHFAKLKYANPDLQFEVIGTDLTQYKTVLPEDITQIVQEGVEDFLNRYRLEPGSLVEVLQICDIDGAFLETSRLSSLPSHSIHYDETLITCVCPEEIKLRNERKREHLAVLSGLSSIVIAGKTVPYSIYYFSCSAEDVFFSRKNNSKGAKKHLALILDKEFATDPEKTIGRFRDPLLFPFDDYRKSWTVLQNETTCIKRLSNLNLWFMAFL